MHRLAHLQPVTSVSSSGALEETGAVEAFVKYIDSLMSDAVDLNMDIYVTLVTLSTITFPRLCVYYLFQETE